MKKIIFASCIFTLLLLACNQADIMFPSLLDRDKLPSQQFTINTTRDTTLLTPKGAVIRIPKGALLTNTENILLEIKEAYNIEHMFRAGLSTQSNGQPLSSGGMIYINAVSKNPVAIKKKISIAIPSGELNDNMKLYRGEMINSNKINWINPVSMPDNPQLTALARGKRLFIADCASCHRIGQDLTGPDLAHIVKRSKAIAKKEGYNYLYAFTRNWNKAYPKSRYYRAVTCWSPSAMNVFEQLTDKELDDLYGYIENESELKNVSFTANIFEKCIDSCGVYKRVKDSLQGIRNRLEEDSVLMVIEKRDNSIVATAQSNITAEALELVQPLANKSLYYQFTIESFGWYNIDILMKDDPRFLPSELTVVVSEQYNQRVNIYLVIPSIKTFLPGGLINKDQNIYGFFEKNGSIPLPPNSKAYIIAIGEFDDKIVFAEKQFITSQKQSFQLELSLINKEEFNTKVKTIQFDELTISVSDTKNANQLRQAVKNLKDAEQLKPQGCDCNCNNQSDSISNKSEFGERVMPK